MAKSYWDMHDEHEEEISKIPYHDNILTYFYEAPSIVRALVERSVSAEKLFSEALHATTKHWQTFSTCGFVTVGKLRKQWSRKNCRTKQTMKKCQIACLRQRRSCKH